MCRGSVCLGAISCLVSLGSSRFLDVAAGDHVTDKQWVKLQSNFCLFLDHLVKKVTPSRMLCFHLRWFVYLTNRFIQKLSDVCHETSF